MHLKKAPCWPYTVFPIKLYSLPYKASPDSHELHCTLFANSTHLKLQYLQYNSRKTSILMKGQPRLSATLNTAPYPIQDLRGELYNRARYDRRRQHQRNQSYTTHSSYPREVRLDCLQQAISPSENHDVGWTDFNPRHDSQIPAQCRSGLEQDLQHRRVIVLLFIVGVFMQACFLTSQNCKDEYPAEDISSQGGARLIESRRRRASCLGLGDAQVERFLLKRDPSGEGVTGSERMVYREVLPYCSYGG